MGWHVYLARCRDGSLYTGISTDPPERIRAHNAGHGASYTRSRRPVVLAWTEPAASRSAALRREAEIKRWPRAGKLRLVEAPKPRNPNPAEAFQGFRPAALDFLRRLRRRNRRDWFERHKAEYLEEVRRPLSQLVEEVDARLGLVAPEFVGDPKRSVFRIHRDVRFSKDKSPYKTHAACWFYHRDAGRGVGREAQRGGAGFYFHLAPDECFLGGGIWRPPRPDLELIRQSIADEPRQFGGILSAPAFKRRFHQLDREDDLRRLPRGYAADSPAAPWLRHQSLVVSRRMTPGEATSPRLADLLLRDYTRILPLVRFLNQALGLPPAERR